MKQIAALLLATVTLLTFGNASASERWGWGELHGPVLLPAAHEESWVPVGVLGRLSAKEATRVNVVPLVVKPAAAKVPGTLSAALPQLDGAIKAIRAVVAQDPALSTNLKARGFGPDDVVGLNRGPSGEVTLFVSNQA
jgi:hypothetical protein